MIKFNHLAVNYYFIKSLLCAVFTAVGLTTYANSTHNLANYQLQVQVQCSSAEAAQAAELKFLPLPPGKNVAFSCRWDDSNFKHVRMKNLMLKYGYKGTFYLTRLSEKFIKEVMPELIKDNCTIGNHTVSHFYLPMHTPNGVHYEMLYSRIVHENISDQTENAFIFPNGKYRSDYFPDASAVIASCLRRCGMLGGPDKATRKLDEMPGNEFFHTNGCDIYPGDTNTDPKKFDAHVTRALPKPGATSHMTLGIHVWHSEEDFVKLEESLKKYANRSDWWYCNENEFNAYSYMLKYAQVIRKEVQGDLAIFTVQMPCPEYLGSNVSLWAECDGKNIELKHTRTVPAKIAMTDANGIADEFPGIVSRIYYTAPDKIVLELENTGSPLIDTHMLLRLPPDFQEETLYFYAGNITGKFRKEWLVTPNTAWQSHGMQLTALQIDFTRDNVGGRIWTTLIKEIPPANKYNVKVYCSGQESVAQEFARWTDPAALIDSKLFALVPQDLNNREGVFSIPHKQRNAKGITVAMDFDGGEKMVLRGTLPEEIYCNGSPLELVNGEVRFDAPAGKCRILLRYGESKSPIKYVKLLLAPESD